MKRRIFFTILLFCAWGISSFSQTNKYRYDIDSVLNKETDYKPLDEYKGLIYLMDKNIHLNTTSFSKKIKIYFFDKTNTSALKTILNKNKKGFFLLVEVDIKKTMKKDSVIINYSLYETSANLFNYKPIWVNGVNRMKGLYVGGNTIPLNYVSEKDKWIPFVDIKKE
jgi:hypothetical protein